MMNSKMRLQVFLMCRIQRKGQEAALVLVNLISSWCCSPTGGGLQMQALSSFSMTDIWFLKKWLWSKMNTHLIWTYFSQKKMSLACLTTSIWTTWWSVTLHFKCLSWTTMIRRRNKSWTIFWWACSSTTYQRMPTYGLFSSMSACSMKPWALVINSYSTNRKKIGTNCSAEDLKVVDRDKNVSNSVKYRLLHAGCFPQKLDLELSAIQLPHLFILR